MGKHPSILAKGLVARLGIKSYPLALTYELSWRCNLSCSYCDRHTPMRSELQRDEIFKTLEQFYALGMRITNLDGGEALLHRNIDEIVDWLVERKITASMHTNGMLIPNKIETVRKLSSVKISLDGPRENHDSMRGIGSFDKALAGAKAAKSAGVEVAFTCTVGSHNIHTIETLIEMAEGLDIPVIFQPAMNSLFLESDRDGSKWQVDAQAIRDAFLRIEQIKRRSKAVGNAWTSLRHFRTFPENTKPPCAAGWVLATLDPEGVLFQCGQVNRSDRSNNVVRLGVAAAFANLNRDGCSQCWCARLVEGNYQWGMRVDRMLPPLRTPEPMNRKSSPASLPNLVEPLPTAVGVEETR
jgi:MoaA/NifB/PqqE/SkfB family radical SAM enzyme